MYEDELKKNFSINIRTLRESKGLNQTELGKLINYSSKAISKWETGLVMPDISTLYLLASFFKVSVDDLITNKNIIKKSNAKRNHALITIAAGLLPFLIGAIVYWVFAWNHLPKPWLPLIASFPASAIVLIVFSAIWYKKILVTIFIQELIWTTAILVMVIMSFYYFWVVLVTAGIASFIALFFFGIDFSKKTKS